MKSMRLQAILAFLLLISLLVSPAQPASASPVLLTYQLTNDLPHPISIDIYRIYWDRDMPTNPVRIETNVVLEPGTVHNCSYVPDETVKGYVYQIQNLTSYYSLSIEISSQKTKTLVSNIVKPENAHLGFYRIPYL